MQSLQTFIERRPALTSTIAVLFAVGLLFIIKIITGEESTLFNWPRLIVLNSISLFTIYLLFKFNWQKSSGLTNPPSTWHRKWFWATLPLLAIALLNLTSVQWQQTDFSSVRVFAWLLSNISTGLFEEVLLRGFCFYILYRAWGSTKKGVFYAAALQAFLFGFAHFGNLYHMPTIDVVAQVTFSTLIGFGFAGLVYLTQSLWPAIIVHTCINCLGTANEFLVPEFAGNDSPGLAGYAVVIVIFMLLSTLPGCLYLKNAKLIHAS